ncbi:hypothetical protein ACSSS7_000976 [Eimeria intestinalis]
MARTAESMMPDGEARAGHAGSDLPDEWHMPDKAAAVGADMLLVELEHAKSCVFLGPEHASIFSTQSSGVQTPKGGDAGAHAALTDNTRIDIALLPAALSSLAASGVPPAAANSMFFASDRAVGANATCVTYAVKPGVARVVCVLEQDAQQNASLYRVTLPDPPPGFSGPRVATGLSLCQEKPHFLLARDQHGLVNVYKRRVEPSPPKGPPAESPPSANGEGGPEAPAGAAAAGGGGSADGTAPFLQLQLQPEHGSLLDAFWLPPMAQESEEGKASAGELHTEGGCFFVTAQEHRVTVWSLPLLRSLAVTLRRQPHPVLAHEAEAADCCCCVLPLREAATPARIGPPDYFSLNSSSNAAPVRVHSVCCAAKQGCLVVGLGGRLVSAWRLRFQRNAVQGAVLVGTQQLPPLFGGATGAPGPTQQQPEALNSNPFFTPCSAPFAGGLGALQQQDQTTQAEDLDSGLPFQLLLLYGPNPAAAAAEAGALGAAAADTPYLAACCNKGALFMQLLPLHLTCKPLQERRPLLGPCQQTLCFGSPEDLTYSINCSKKSGGGGSSSSSSSSEFHSWAITDPSQRFAVVGITRMCPDGPRSHLCIFDAQQQRQQEKLPPLSSVLLMRLDLPMVRLGAAVVAGAPASGAQQQGGPDEGAAVYCYCVFVYDKDRQQKLPQQQQQQQRQSPDLLRLHYIECSKLTAAATLDWQQIPSRSPIAAAAPAASTASPDEEAAKPAAAATPAAAEPTAAAADTGRDVQTAAEVGKDAAAAETEGVDPAGAEVADARTPPADAASHAVESPSSGAAQQTAAAALPEQDVQQPAAETAPAAAAAPAADVAAKAATEEDLRRSSNSSSRGSSSPSKGTSEEKAAGRPPRAPSAEAETAAAAAAPAAAAAAAMPAVVEAAPAAAPAAAEAVASDPAILLALRVPPAAADGVLKNEVPTAATAESASNELMKLLLGRNKGPCSAILEAPAEAAAACPVSPPPSLAAATAATVRTGALLLAAALPGAAKEKGSSSLPAASAASQERSKAPFGVDAQREAAAASPTEAATPTPAAPAAAAAKDKADGTSAAATTGGRRKGKQQQQQQASAAAPAAASSSAAAAAAEPATASPAAATGKGAAATPGGAPSGSGATLKGSGGSSKPADSAQQQQSPKSPIGKKYACKTKETAFAAAAVAHGAAAALAAAALAAVDVGHERNRVVAFAAAASETAAEAAAQTAGSRPVTMGAIENLLAKATGELTQKISVAVSAAAVAAVYVVNAAANVAVFAAASIAASAAGFAAVAAEAAVFAAGAIAAAANGAAKANASNQLSEKQQQQQQQRLATLVATEVQRLFSAQLQTAVQEACEAAKVAASLEASVSEQLQQHLASACKVHEEQQRVLQQQMHHLVHGLQQQLQKWQQSQQQQIQQLTRQIQQIQQQTVLQQQQVQHLQHLHEKLQERQLALEEAPTGRLLDNLESLNFDGIGKSLSKIRVQVQEARDEAKQAVAQQQHQQQVQHQQHAVVLDQLTQLSAQVGGLSASSRAAAEVGPLAMTSGEAPLPKAALSSRPKARTEVVSPLENERDYTGQFTRKLNGALEEKRYDDAFGLAVSADLQKGNKGQWLCFLCGNINPTQFFDMDPPPLGQAALLGIVKVLSDSLAAEAMSAELGAMETKALWVCEALMQLNAPSKNIATPDLLELPLAHALVAKKPRLVFDLCVLRDELQRL